MGAEPERLRGVGGEALLLQQAAIPWLQDFPIGAVIAILGVSGVSLAVVSYRLTTRLARWALGRWLDPSAPQR